LDMWGPCGSYIFNNNFKKLKNERTREENE